MLTQRIGAVVAGIVFVLCVALVVINQRETGWVNLGFMLAGLTGLIVLLALYNRRFR